MDRPRPEYDAKGLPLGAFRLRLSLDTGVTYDDNVFRTEASKESDYFFTIAPAFVLTSDWSQHKLEVTGSLTRYQYNKHGSEDRTDWNLGANGRIDVLRGTFIEGSGAYAVAHEPRFAPDEPGNAAQPTEFSQSHADFRMVHQPAQLGLSLGASFDRFVYEPTPLIGGGDFSNSDRDRNQYAAFVKIRYETSPGVGFFVRGSFEERRFDEQFDHNGFDRDSQGYRADAGLEFFPSHLIKGELFAGYVHEIFHAPFENIDAFDFGANLTWYATPLMTVHLAASRSFNPTTIAGASVTDDKKIGLSLDYELLRDLILQGGVNYLASRFVGIDRDDKYLTAGLNAKWLINRYMSLNFGYVYSQRNSTEAGHDFTDNAATAALHLQL